MQRGDDVETKGKTSKAMPDGLKSWLVTSLVVLVGSLMIFAGDVAAEFAYFSATTSPAWVATLGAAAVIGIGLGTGGLFLVFLLTTLKSRREEAARAGEQG